MRTYTISELGPEAKERALNSIMADSNFQNKEVDLDWKVEGIEEDLEVEFGIKNAEVQFTGFHSQGDGASFTGNVGDIPKFIRAIGITEEIPDKIMEALEENYEMRSVRMDYRHVHENTVTFEIEDVGETELILMSGFGIGDVTMDLNGLLEEIGLEAKASKWLKEKCKEIYRELFNEYEKDLSPEAAEEWADNMGMEFDLEGNEV